MSHLIKSAGSQFSILASLEFRIELIAVWCWGWDGAGDLDGPDVDPIWEPMPKKSYSEDSIKVKHFRNIPGF